MTSAVSASHRDHRARDLESFSHTFKASSPAHAQARSRCATLWLKGQSSNGMRHRGSSSVAYVAYAVSVDTPRRSRHTCAACAYAPISVDDEALRLMAARIGADRDVCLRAASLVEGVPPDHGGQIVDRGNRASGRRHAARVKVLSLQVPPPVVSLQGAPRHQAHSEAL